MQMMKNIERLTNILLSLNNRVNPPDFDEADRGFLAAVSCKDIALAQQNLLATGLAPDQLWRLWTQNNRILPDPAAKLRAELPAKHILQRVLAEHEMILCFIADLDEVANTINNLRLAASTNTHIRKLAHIAMHLVYSEQHHEREEQIIFPQLRKRGYHRLLKIIDEQHRQIKQRYHELKELVWQVDSINFDEFKIQLRELAAYLVIALRIHIFIEANIIFPLALEVIKDSRIWQRMKETCDQIGYCGYDAQ
ncbi:MAG: hemerythrin domain-containing protein [Planctomycetota bacterium]|jgi:DUF438 domain-containing protein